MLNRHGLVRLYFCPQTRGYVRIGIGSQYGLAKKSFKEGGADGNLIAAVICGIDEDDTAFVDGIWVEERYRRQGIGSWLFSEIERGAKEKGAYVILSYCCDWVSAFFFQNGFTARGKLENYPKGHTAYELEKRI